MTQVKDERVLQIIEGGKEKCPNCKGYNHEPSYGMACGGIGSYNICFDCSNCFGFVPDEDSYEEAPNGN